MVNGTWEFLTSDVVITIISLRTGLSLSYCAALYELVIRDEGYNLFLDLFQEALDEV
jgi:hypothetical protein